jgi:AcrR family transcriptional regulator
MVQSYNDRVAPSSAEERLAQVVRAATKVFATKGYRRTQMTDVAAELGVSAGNLYNYVQSKEALFHVCLATASPAGEQVSGPLPLTTPTPKDTMALIRRGTKAIREPGALARALASDPPDDAAEELAAVIGEFYDKTARSRRFQALLESSAHDLPELFDAYFVKMRRPALRSLTDYLERRIASGHLRPVPDVATTARLINETQAWFARHRRGDQDSGDVDDELARETVIDVLVASMLPRE